MGASTIHALFDLDGAFQSRLDFARFDNPKVKALLDMQMLLLDECSMLDVEIWTTIVQILGCIDHTRRPDARDADDYGGIHLILFGDFKCPPCSVFNRSSRVAVPHVSLKHEAAPAGDQQLPLRGRYALHQRLRISLPPSESPRHFGRRGKGAGTRRLSRGSIGHLVVS